MQPASIPPADKALLRPGLEKLRQGLHFDAVMEFTGAVALSASDPEPRLFRALAYRSLGRRREALEDILAYIRLSPASTATFLQAAGLLRSLDFGDAALALAARALELEPRSCE